MTETAASEEAEDEPGSALNAALHTEYWGWDHHACVVYCRDEHPRNVRRARRGERCPHCYGKVIVRSIHGTEVEPAAGKMERAAGWLGGWIGALWQAITYPWRLDQARLRALLAELLEAGMRAEVVQVCPQCEEAEADEAESLAPAGPLPGRAGPAFLRRRPDVVH
jgi:hypothetical protein